MKRILINATHIEEVRVALCKDDHLYDFDLENRTREQKKSNVYKGYVTRVEQSLEAVFVEYGSARQGFLPLREIAPEYLSGNTREDNIKKLIKEGDEVLVQVSKEERGNKGAALTTYISLAGRYLVLMPNNPKGGGISRQISGKVREEMRQIINELTLPKGMSVIVRTAGIGKTFEDLQNDLDHLLGTWQDIQRLNREQKSPYLMHQEASVVTRAVRDYLRDDIGEVWIDNENAYNEAASFIAAVMPTQMHKLRKYTDFEPMFGAFGIERQIETAYQREVRLPSGGSIVIDQTEALVSIDINSAKSTKGSDVAETAYHTNLEAAEEIARQLRLRDMGGLIVIDFIDMSDPAHQKNVEKRLIEATRYDRARVQFAEISRFGLLEMSRQRLRPSLEETTGYLCPRCHGNGIVRDLRSLSLSIMRQIEQLALKHRSGEIQAEVPTEIAAFLLNEKRESLVYLEQDSGARVTILPHAHLESPNFSLHFNPDGFAPASYERIVDAEEQQADRGYDVNWQTKQDDKPNTKQNHWQQSPSSQKDGTNQNQTPTQAPKEKISEAMPAKNVQAVAWLSNLFAPKPQAKMAHSLSNEEAAAAIESIVNTGANSLGAFGQLVTKVDDKLSARNNKAQKDHRQEQKERDNRDKSKTRKEVREEKGREKDNRHDSKKTDKQKPIHDSVERERYKDSERHKKDNRNDDKLRREPNTRREPRAAIERNETLMPASAPKVANQESPKALSPDQADPFVLHILPSTIEGSLSKVVHLSLDNPSTPGAEVEGMSTDVVNQDAVDNVQPAQVMAKQTCNSQELVGQLKKENTTDNKADEVLSLALGVDTHLSVQSSQVNSLIQKASQKNKKNQAIDDALLTTIADKFGLAKNDPRVVYEALNQTQAGDKNKNAIMGTAGEFINKTLPNAKALLADLGFVSCFIEAMNQARQQTISDFDFANYGYAHLSDDYIHQFNQMVQVSGQFSVGQGKTHAVPKPSVRAKNDPRGAVVQPVADVSVTESADIHHRVHDSHLLGSIQPLLDAILADLDKISNELASKLSAAKESTSEAVHQAIDGVGHRLEMVLDLDDKMDVADVSDNKQISASDKPKSSKKHYKDMIENVAEQLLPQTGILNLSLPKSSPKSSKATKVRIKKPKPNLGKPKVEVIKRAKLTVKADSQDVNDGEQGNS